MTITLNDIINYGSATFKVVKFSTSEDIKHLQNSLDDLSYDCVQIGTIISYCINDNIPYGYLICDGSVISRTTYATLFQLIGTTYGIGDGETTFNIPNLTDKFLQGNSVAGTNKSAGLPNITGSIRTNNNGSYWYSRLESSGVFNSEDSRTLASISMNQGSTGTVKSTFDASRSSSIYGNSTTVQPPAMTVRFLIKVFNKF